MPSQPASGPSGRPVVGVDLPLRRPEWDLLVRLPRTVLVSACAGDDRVDAVAGVEAIAAGQRSRALLVRAVVAAIFAEQLTDTDIDAGSGDGAIGGATAGLLVDCGFAVRLLAERLGADTALAYGEWLMDIAASVGRIAWRPGLIRLRGVDVHFAGR